MGFRRRRETLTGVGEKLSGFAVRENDGVIYGFMDNSLDFSPASPASREKLSRLIADRRAGRNAYTYEVRQSHGDNIIDLKDYPAGAGVGGFNIAGSPDADGAFTDMSGIALCIRTADCVPLLFMPAKGALRGAAGGKVIGAVHSGWKGAYAGIIAVSKNILASGFNVRLEDVAVIIGPSICKNCYEVKEDFLSLFLKKDASLIKFFERRAAGKENKIFFDLKGFVKNELLLNGFNLKNICDLNKCNFEDAAFFSYRRGDIVERQVSFIAGL